MADRTWQFRMNAHYTGEGNSVSALTVERFVDEAWAPFDLNVRTPGFLVFLYSLFTCQHQYMHLNAAERGLVLSGSSGTLEVVASEGWMLQRLSVQFDARLVSGTVTQEAVDYIQQRMQACPVSRNIQAPAVHASTVVFHKD